MSSRQLRKLQQQRELQQANLNPQAEESEESEVEQAPPAKLSLFANLAALEDQGEEDEEEVEENNESQEKRESPESISAVTPKTSKKPKKKKKSKAKNRPQENKSHEPTGKETDQDGFDEIDEALRELNVQDELSGKSKDVWAPTNDSNFDRICKLIGATTQHLKVANEMRNLFGRTAFENNDNAGGPVGRGARQRQRGQNQQVDLETALKGHHAPGKGLPELTLRRNPFIQGKTDWPKATTGGLTMELVGSQGHDDGTMEFRIVHDKAYQEVQGHFHAFVEMGDPQNLITLLTKNPYHISLLIQVSKIAKDQGDHALSADLLERALFTFGRASISLFHSKLSSGKARLSFARPENRELWLAGYHYIKSLVMKGTCRTALEWAKLLLSLDTDDDPYCMRLMIHQLALRAHEFDWLLDVMKAETGVDRVVVLGSFNMPSIPFAGLQLRDKESSRSQLKKTMEQQPWVFCRLFKELNLDTPGSIWGIEPRTEAERLFAEIYVLQTKDLWNTPEATFMLTDIATRMSKVDVSKLPQLSNDTMTLDVVRFVYLDNNPALMALAPSNLLHRRNDSDSDPLPPDKNIFSYPLQEAMLRRQGGNGLSNNFYDPIDAIGNLLPPLRDFLERGGRFDAERDVDDEDDEDEGEGPRAIRVDITDMLRAAASGAFDPGSWAGRMWGVLGGRERNRDPEDDDEDEGTETEDENELPDLIDREPRGGDLSTDEEIPDLLDENGNPVDNEEDETSDDDMPGLVEADSRLRVDNGWDDTDTDTSEDEDIPDLVDTDGRPVSGG